MGDWPHKVKDVLEINIDGTITPFIVLDFKYSHIIKLGEKYLVCQSVFAFDQVWPRSPLILKCSEHRITNSPLIEMRLKNCYELLMGDEKIWLQYSQDYL